MLITGPVRRLKVREEDEETGGGGKKEEDKIKTRKWRDRCHKKGDQ